MKAPTQTTNSKGFKGEKRVSLRKSVELVVFDFDGVLTDNRVFVFDDGREAVQCCRSDGLAFDMLRKAQIAVLILSTETNKVVAVRAQKLKVPVLQGKKNKKGALADYCRRHRINLARVLYVGNDLNDLSAMKDVGFPACPRDAHPEIRRIARWVFKKNGGSGVARELVENLLGLTLD